jgi:hypothetical protein
MVFPCSDDESMDVSPSSTPSAMKPSKTMDQDRVQVSSPLKWQLDFHMDTVDALVLWMFKTFFLAAAIAPPPPIHHTGSSPE